MPQFTVSWRFTVLVLAAACFGNASIMFVVDEPTPLTTVIGMVSTMAGAALMASLWFPVRRFTLVVAASALWLQVVETALESGLPPWSKARLALVFFALGMLAFGTWVHTMRERWPRGQWWQLPLI